MTPDLEADYCGGQRGTRATRGVPFFAPTTQGSGMMVGNTPTLGMDLGRTKVLMPLVDKRGIPERRFSVGTGVTSLLPGLRWSTLSTPRHLFWAAE